MKILLKNVTIITMDEKGTVYGNGYLLTEEDIIREVGELVQEGCPPEWSGDGNSSQKWAALKEEEADLVIDGQGGILCPGFVNTHCHVPMMPFRTLGDDCADRLRRFLFPLENDAMTERLTRLSARYGICEMLLAGVTTFADMYYFEDQVAEACEELGIRGVLGETVIGQPACDSPAPYGGLKLAERFIERWRGHERITPMIAPHAANTNSPEMLKAAYDIALAYDTPFTLHASEMDYEMTYFQDAYGKTPTKFLADLGVLSKRVLLAHCIHMTDEDLDLLQRAKVSVSHCIGSNTKAGKGVAPVRKMAERGIPVGLGTDGASSGNTLDLFTQMRLFASFHKTANHDRSVFPVQEILGFGTINGARALRMENQIGSLKPGKKADLALIETRSVNMFPCYNPCSALVYSANASNVELVMVNGQILVRGKTLVHTDLDRVRQELAEEMGAFMEAAKRYGDMV